jgi:hypothetical protein
VIHTRWNRKRQRSGLAVGFGVAGVGVLFGLLGQLGDVSVAHADDYSTIVADIQGVETLGQADLSDAAVAFDGGSVVQGLADTFTGLDDTTVSPGEWLVLGGSDALTGAALPASGWFDFDDTLIAPANWSDALADAANLTSLGDDFLTAASDAFTGGDPSTGLSDLLIAGDFFGILEPQELALGLASISL